MYIGLLLQLRVYVSLRSARSFAWQPCCRTLHLAHQWHLMCSFIAWYAHVAPPLPPCRASSPPRSPPSARLGLDSPGPDNGDVLEGVNRLVMTKADLETTGEQAHVTCICTWYCSYTWRARLCVAWMQPGAVCGQGAGNDSRVVWLAYIASLPSWWRDPQVLWPCSRI